MLLLSQPHAVYHIKIRDAIVKSAICCMPVSPVKCSVAVTNNDSGYIVRIEYISNFKQLTSVNSQVLII